MKRPVAAVLILPSLLALAACGNLKDRLFGTKKDDKADFAAAGVEGSWIRSCLETEALRTPLNQQSQLSITGDDYARTDTFYPDLDCQGQPTLTKEWKGHFTVGDSHDSLTRDLQITVDSLVVTPLDEATAAHLRAINHCGVGDWQTGQAVAVTALLCREFSNQGEALNGVQMPDLNGTRALQLVNVAGQAISSYGSDVYTRPDALIPPRQSEACEYLDVPGQAEILVVDPENPPDAQSVWLSLRFTSTDPDGLVNAQLREPGAADKDSVTMARVPYGASCVAGNQIAAGTKTPMTLKKVTKGDCGFLAFEFPAVTPDTCKTLSP